MLEDVFPALPPTNGIVMLSSELQPEKAPLAMLVTLFPMVTDVKPLQPEKASTPMLVTLSGMTMDVRPVQL